MLFFDTETCGFNGPLILIQYAVDDYDPVLWNVWTEPVLDSLSVLEEFGKQDVVGFNLSFDWFHIVKIHAMLQLLYERKGNVQPIGFIQEMAALEADARFGPCIKPKSALDLMLFARKGPYQSTMDRKPVYIRKIPTAMVEPIITELTSRLQLKTLYRGQWKQRLVAPGMSDLLLRFNPTGSLKALVVDTGIRDTRSTYESLKAPPPPYEASWAPFATAISKGPMWRVERKVTWPGIILDHIGYWAYSNEAQQYALADVVDTRALYRHFGNPETGDDDSELACMVGAVRWRGYSIDVEAAKREYDRLGELAKSAPTGDKKAYAWLSQVMTPMELEHLRDDKNKISTAKLILQEISAWNTDCSCVTYEKKLVEKKGGFGGTIKSYETERHFVPTCSCIEGNIRHLAAVRAEAILTARQSKQKRATLRKLLDAGRFHPSASVIGSLSGRMSGRTTGASGERIKGLNALGINRDRRVRELFTFADTGYALDGGDFEAYEIAIAAAAYNDTALNNQLLSCNECGHIYDPDEYRKFDHCPSCGCSYTNCKTCKGQTVVRGNDIVKPCRCGKNNIGKGRENTTRKIHALFAMELYPGKTYNDIVASKSTAHDMYDAGKRSIFGGLLYGGDENTMLRRVGIPLEVGKPARDKFFNRFPGIKAEQTACYERFCSMRQEGGLGTKVSWVDPQEYVESLTGFRRYFTLENQIAKTLYTMASDPPESLAKYKGNIIRRDKEQTFLGAVRSALYGAAFQLQAACMRAALNHRIQSTGAILTKRLQRKIWDHQPSGVHEFLVVPMQVHDEVICPSKVDLFSTIEQFINDTKELVPLIHIQWKSGLKNWSEK